jgi:hypothetical protein
MAEFVKEMLLFIVQFPFSDLNHTFKSSKNRPALVIKIVYL